MPTPQPLVQQSDAVKQARQQQRLALAALAVGLGATAAVVALVVPQVRRQVQRPETALLLRPAAVDWLDEVIRSGAEETAQTPAPPLQQSWQSPLLKACPAVDPALQQRLLSMPVQVRSIQADPSNYGERVSVDAKGQRIDPTPAVIVLHETVYSLSSAVNTFTTPHPNDANQASYHTLVGLNGEIVQVLDPSKRAYGAGHSAFDGRWVFTSKHFSGSINNFALHVSLETPPDGVHSGGTHSGYTQKQYDALSRVLADWMVRFHIEPTAITTHRHVDQGRARSDPRSFAWPELQTRLTSLGLVC